MSTKKSSAEKRTDSTGRVRPKYVPLGVDKNGSEHLYATDDHVVHIIHDDGSRARIPLRDGFEAREYVDGLYEIDAWSRILYGPRAHSIDHTAEYR